eukprot:5265631-Amphidinium_carterae.3
MIPRCGVASAKQRGSVSPSKTSCQVDTVNDTLDDLLSHAQATLQKLDYLRVLKHGFHVTATFVGTSTHFSLAQSYSVAPCSMEARAALQGSPCARGPCKSKCSADNMGFWQPRCQAHLWAQETRSTAA